MRKGGVNEEERWNIAHGKLGEERSLQAKKWCPPTVRSSDQLVFRYYAPSRMLTCKESKVNKGFNWQ